MEEGGVVARYEGRLVDPLLSTQEVAAVRLRNAARLEEKQAAQRREETEAEARRQKLKDLRRRQASEQKEVGWDM